ncbi:CmpA/NrtA family ABC transporter substrate-binding protein [Trinickia soli]|uniref:Nitrate ABC transporter substrate-binding protein n=1 Tax=Trinickia soli TaxID=380675 RepID=A0A2N7VF61_9BURK|nr:CmpA/NrtA family ABC transporter substrate-binding protein [Trinickia soli]PMS15785.1 nitrate ABC transporter substrate-binding protein [Trinickia soli]CAB3728350.1 Nitrate/nitrite binding protein NrtA [Trinickia soli]
MTHIASNGPEALEKAHLRIGFVALSDAAPLIAAKVLEFGHRHGLTLELCRQPSWAAVRDKLISGEIDCAHALYGLVYGVELGIGGPRDEMAVLMVLNRNGQAITLSSRLAGALDAEGDLKAALATLGRPPVFAQTFPTGTHALWLYYWLAMHGVNPREQIESVVIPPPRMVDALEAGTLDGFCAGEPWHAVAEARGAGQTVIATSEIWPDHPEKVLACRRAFVERYPATARALVRTMLEACRWVDAPGHRDEISHWLAKPDALDVPRDLIAPRLVGREGGKRFKDAPLPVAFFGGGAVNYPRVSEGRWFLAQYRRWGLLREAEVPASHDEAIAARINQTALYCEAAAMVDPSWPLPDEAAHVDTFCDDAIRR